MDSDSDEVKYDTSGTEDEEMEPRPLSIAFYRQTMARARFYHNPRFLHFMGNNRTVDSHDILWKIRDLFEILRTNFAKFYNPSEHLFVDEIIVKFKGRVIFKQYIPKNAKVSASNCTNSVTPTVTPMTWTVSG
jgi:hypothetical protein